MAMHKQEQMHEVSNSSNSVRAIAVAQLLYTRRPPTERARSHSQPTEKISRAMLP